MPAPPGKARQPLKPTLQIADLDLRSNGWQIHEQITTGIADPACDNKGLSGLIEFPNCPVRQSHAGL